MDTSPLSRHHNIVLQFSGGKDSIACLLLLIEHLDRITVLWMNPGETLPETYAQMERVRAICPNFIEVHSDLSGHIEKNGYPVDLLPIRNEKPVQFLTQINRLPLQGFMACCIANLMQPMHAATLAQGATLIIRGQKDADDHRSPVRSGSVIGEVEYWFPVQEWTDEQVLDFIEDSGLLPENHDRSHTSLDCWSCTAYLAEHKWKQPYLEKFHPGKAAEVRRRLILIKNEILSELKNLEV